MLIHYYTGHSQASAPMRESISKEPGADMRGGPAWRTNTRLQIMCIYCTMHNLGDLLLRREQSAARRMRTMRGSGTYRDRRRRYGLFTERLVRNGVPRAAANRGPLVCAQYGQHGHPSCRDIRDSRVEAVKTADGPSRAVPWSRQQRSASTGQVRCGNSSDGEEAKAAQPPRLSTERR